MCLLRDGIFFLQEKGYDMRIDLRDDEVIDIEHLGETCHRKVIVNRSVNPALWRRVPRHRLAGLRVFGKDRCCREDQGYRA